VGKQEKVLVMSKVSVVMLVYNVEKYLDNALSVRIAIMFYELLKLYNLYEQKHDDF
jgi:glycosyltransferase involved in cell wall biosynthesis